MGQHANPSHTASESVDASHGDKQMNFSAKYFACRVIRVTNWTGPRVLIAACPAANSDHPPKQNKKQACVQTL